MRLLITSTLTALVLSLGMQQASAVELTAAVGRTDKSTSTLRIGWQKDLQ